ncbi:hypothetical protein E2C01_047165 [Portunus trituberculatus]|uniref:Uncharacterized protein n=1 Tax=Portunus trituberculatus TaxID=210409 RepID=A0A5B7G710_PORTR|nr:hypothetical protein [Portunus trituberculatus]
MLALFNFIKEYRGFRQAEYCGFRRLTLLVCSTLSPECSATGIRQVALCYSALCSFLCLNLGLNITSKDPQLNSYLLSAFMSRAAPQSLEASDTDCFGNLLLLFSI